MMQSQKIREVSLTRRNLFFSTSVHAGLGCGTGVSDMTRTNVLVLRPIERVLQDAEPIATMYRNLGTSSAEQVVTRALGELAENRGLVSLGLVAADVRNCLDSSDVTAFAAVWARLLRIAERSLSSDKALLGQTLI